MDLNVYKFIPGIDYNSFAEMITPYTDQKLIVKASNRKVEDNIENK